MRGIFTEEKWITLEYYLIFHFTKWKYKCW